MKSTFRVYLCYLQLSYKVVALVRGKFVTYGSVDESQFYIVY